jgi:3-deoxy-D-manno-octulosonate 8-phosphate phosphatase (KDO 8-P phosphatase)
MNSPYPEPILARAARVRCAAFDVDGVLTDGRLLLGPTGEEFKVFHVRDGQGLVMLREHGIHLAIITGRASPVVALRMAELGIRHVHQGCRDKLAIFTELLAECKLSPQDAAYMGDDLPDLPTLRAAGLAVTVADAHPALAQHCHFRTRLPGGRGAVRELCDLLLYAQGALSATDLGVDGEAP